ncbi:hypothetical protein FB451DRAFT_1419779 [Mycena latifolia]|nr:hypothetical protein FB451DRAFT_1419779 [Mycena latifolia]
MEVEEAGVRDETECGASSIDDIDKDRAAVIDKVGELRAQLSASVEKVEGKEVEELVVPKEGDEGDLQPAQTNWGPLLIALAEWRERIQAGNGDEGDVDAASMSDEDDEVDPQWAYAVRRCMDACREPDRREWLADIAAQEQLERARELFAPMSPQASEWYPRLARRRARLLEAVAESIEARAGVDGKAWDDYSTTEAEYVDV